MANYLPVNIAKHPTRFESPRTMPSGPQISQKTISSGKAGSPDSSICIKNILSIISFS
jgi:hypothetical protein